MMQRLLHIARSKSLYLLLLPLFFIWHSWIEYAGILDSTQCIIAWFEVTASVLIGYFLLSRFTRSREKAAVITCVTAIIVLFFADIKNALAHIPLLNYLGHYKIFVPLVIVLWIVILVRVRRSSNVLDTNLFLNLLLVIYLLLDTGKLIWSSSDKTGITNVKLKQVQIPKEQLPDIYYVLLDCYPSGSYQQEMLNTSHPFFLDSILSKKGFYVVKEPRSNYDNTAFSMSSTLGMEMLTNIDTVNRMAAHHYNRAMSIVKHSPLFELLKRKGYNIHNYSIFDIQDKPAMKKDVFLAASTTQILFYNTLWKTIPRDFIWQLQSGRTKTNDVERIKELKEFFDPQKKYNARLLDSLSKFMPGTEPDMLYLHFEMPHFPYFFDAKGKEYPDEEVYTDSMITDRKKFSGYIDYANGKAEEIISKILAVSDSNAVIIVQSDHCIADLDWTRKDDAFRNFSAFYFPDKKYDQLYGGLSNVNTFRLILNKYFGQQLPLLPDKSYFTH
jgi:hypothetical protein